MDTNVVEIAENIYRLSTHIPQAGPGGFTFNQFLIDAEQPLLFHTGLRMNFPSVSAAVASVVPLVKLRWIAFGHYEADECGAMNEFLAAAPHAAVATGQIAAMLSIADQADRPPQVLADGEVLDLGGKRVKRIDTPHVPHGWDAGLLYEETTGTLLAGDLFTIGGKYGAETDANLLEKAARFEDMMPYTCLTANTAPTIERLAALKPKNLALMHNAAFHGDGESALRELAGFYRDRFQAATP